MYNLISRQFRKINQIIRKKTFKKHKLDNVQESIFNEIKEKGLFQGKIDILKKISVNLNWLNHTDYLIRELDKEHQQIDLTKKIKGSYSVGLRNQIENFILEDIYKFGLSTKLVEIIENYFQMPLLFRGVDLRKDLNDGKNIETRVWHLDAEDSSLIKILFYLEKVDENSGPFSYIEKKYLSKKNKLKKEHDGRINQEEVLKVVNASSLKIFCSNTDEFIMADTANIYHKGELPIKKNRYAIFFCYCSKFPLEPLYCKNLQNINNKKDIFDKNIISKIA